MTLSVQQAWQRYFPPVREKCRRVLLSPQEADDVAQETFIKFWQARVATDDPARVLAWLYCTATRGCIDRLRARATRAAASFGQEATSPDLESSTASRQALGRLASIVDTDELEVAVLSRLDAMTQPDIARVLNVSERTVRRLLTRFDERVAAFKSEAM